MRARHLGLFLALLVGSSVGCVADDGATSTPNASIESPAPGSSPQPLELTVMTLNIEYGGDLVSFDEVVAAIQVSDADIVGIEEAWGQIPRLARALGWAAYDTRLQLVSRYPLIDPPGANGAYTFVEVVPGGVVAIGNVHLPSSPSGPYKLLHGASVDEVLRLEERVRVPAVEPFVEELASLAADGVPAFLVGDFNAPSHRDYIEDTVGALPQIVAPVSWPVSMAVEEAGFRDTYRDAHPDPSKDPGLTWPADRPEVGGYNPSKGAPHDRIDFVYSAGPASTVGSFLVGEVGGPDVDVSVEPWPTDHRGVVSQVEVQPSPLPTLVAVVERLVDRGEELEVRYQGPGARVVTVPAGGAGVDARAEVPVEGTGGSVMLPTDGLAPGAFEAAFLDADGGEIARIPFWVREPGAPPSVSTDAGTYGEGDPIGVSWANTGGNRWDWVGIYRRGADPNIAPYLLWFYTDALVGGQAAIDGAAYGRWPLRPGEYSVHVLVDDGYEAIASADFEVVA